MEKKTKREEEGRGRKRERKKIGEGKKERVRVSDYSQDPRLEAVVDTWKTRMAMGARMEPSNLGLSSSDRTNLMDADSARFDQIVYFYGVQSIY